MPRTRRPFWMALGGGLALAGVIIEVSLALQRGSPPAAPPTAPTPPHPNALQVLTFIDFQ